MKSTDLPDLVLSNRLKSGERSAFDSIYNRYYGVLYVFAYKLTTDEEQAKDLVQDVFVSLWENKADADIKTLSSYLYGSVRFQFLKMLRHKKVHDKYIDGFLAFLSEVSTYEADEWIREKDLKARIEALANRLPGKMGQVFLMSRFEHLSNEEIAEKLSISEKTTANLLSLATKNIRPILKSLILLFY